MALGKNRTHESVMNAGATLVRLHQLDGPRQTGHELSHHPLLDLELRNDLHDRVFLVPRRLDACKSLHDVLDDRWIRFGRFVRFFLLKEERSKPAETDGTKDQRSLLDAGGSDFHQKLVT